MNASRTSRYLPLAAIAATLTIGISQPAYCYDPTHGSTIMETTDVAPKQLEGTRRDSHNKQKKAAVDPLRVRISQLLQSAQTSVEAQKYEEALAKLSELDGIAGKTPEETYVADRTRVVIASKTANEPLLAKSLESVIASGRLPVAERSDFLKALARTYYKQNNYKQAVAWATRYLDEGGNDAETRELLTQSYYFDKDYAHAAQQARADISAAEAAGKTPAKDEVHILLNSTLKLNDQAGYASAVEKAATYYPKKDYWTFLLNHVASRVDFPERLALDVYRLMLVTGQITTAKDFMDMSTLAQQSGYSGEARKIIDKGFESGVLGTGRDAAAQRQWKATVTKAAAAESKSLDTEAAAFSGAGRNNELIDLGYRYVVDGQAQKGIGLMEKAVQTGGNNLRHPNEARLHLATAYALAGQKENAIRTFKTVSGDDSAAELARYWMIYLKNPL